MEITNLNLKSESFQSESFKLAPHPQFCQYRKGLLSFNSNFNIITNLGEAHNFIIHHLTKEISEFLSQIPNYNLKILAGRENNENFPDFPSEYGSRLGIITAGKNGAKKNFHEQGYVLDINKNTQTVALGADTPQGIFYGVQTLFQLFLTIYEEKDCIVPGIFIIDYPDMSLRGISDDVSRGQAATVEGLKHFIIELSRFKFNHYFMYIEDVVKFKAHPTIGVNRGALSAEEIKEVSRFASKYFVTFSPIFESLGHMDNILSLSEYVNLAEFPGSDCLDVSNPAIYPLLDSIYKELAEMFTSDHFHVACDESWEMGTVRSRKYVEEKGEAQVYLDHYTKIYKLAKNHNKSNIYLYHDIAYKYKEVLEGLPKDYILVYWDYSKGKAGKGTYPKLDRIVDAGFRTIVSPAVHDWNRIFPSMDSMEKNTERIIKYGYQKGSFGEIQSSWGDFKNENLRENRLYGFAFASVCAWNIEDFSTVEFWPLFLKFFYHTVDPASIEILTSTIQTYREIMEGGFLSGVNYTKFWAQPFDYPKLKIKPSKFLATADRLVPLIKDLEHLKHNILRNQLNVDVLIFQGEMFENYMRKWLIARKINKISKDEIGSLPLDTKNELLHELEWMDSSIMDLKQKFEKLWTVHCSPANIPSILNAFDAIDECYLQRAKEIRFDLPAKPQSVPLEWICAKRKKSAERPRIDFYRKKLTIPEGFKKVFIQVIGDTHSLVYINGKLIEEFYSKSTLSIRMLENIIGFFEITEHCKAGENTICIENRNYKDGYGVIGVYGEIFMEKHKGTEVSLIKAESFISDISWTATSERNESWIAGGELEVPLNKVISLGKPPMVSGSLGYPNFLNGRKSHCTSTLGALTGEFRRIPSWIYPLIKTVPNTLQKRGIGL